MGLFDKLLIGAAGILGGIALLKAAEKKAARKQISFKDLDSIRADSSKENYVLENTLTVKEAANRLHEGLFNICFNIPQYDYYSNTGKYLINQSVFEQSLDSLQSLSDTCERTSDPSFNKLSHNVLGTLFAMLYYYYQGGTRYIDYAMYETKVLLDKESIYLASDFFRRKFVENEDCYLVLMESDERDMLQIPIWSDLTKSYHDSFMVMPLRLFRRGEQVKVKRMDDSEYTSFNYNPSNLISTIKFSVSNNKIVGQIDNSMWEDSAWNS